MKFFVATAAFVGDALVNLLEDSGYYDKGGSVDAPFIKINTTKETFKFVVTTPPDKEVYDVTRHWNTIVNLLDGLSANADVTPSSSIAATAVFAVGDVVTAVNLSNTKGRFRLDETRNYVIDRITASGKIGLAGLPNDEYLPKRFTKVAGSPTTTGACSAPAPASAVDAKGTAIAVGDYVLVVEPTRRDGRFALPEGGVLQVTEITAKGNIGFGGDDQYRPSRVERVELEDVIIGNLLHVQSGDAVVCVRNGKHRRTPENGTKFALPLFRALTFRGVTLDGGKFILDGYTDHQYSPLRFKRIIRF